MAEKKNSNRKYGRNERKYGKWVGPEKFAASKEHRNCGPLAKLTFKTKQGARVSSLFVLNVIKDDDVLAEFKMALVRNIHLGFATPKAARMAGNVDLWATHERILRPMRAYQLLED